MKDGFGILRAFLLQDTTHVPAGTRAHRFRAVPHLTGDLPDTTDVLTPHGQSPECVTDSRAAPFGGDDDRYCRAMKCLIVNNLDVPIGFNGRRDLKPLKV